MLTTLFIWTFDKILFVSLKICFDHHLLLKMTSVSRLLFLPKEEDSHTRNLDKALSIRNSYDFAEFSLVFHIVAKFKPCYPWASFRCVQICRKIPQIFTPSVVLAWMGNNLSILHHYRLFQGSLTLFQSKGLLLF